MIVGKGYMETYGKLTCDGCGKQYFVCFGDLEDLTLEDVMIAKCPYCNTKQVLPGIHVEHLDEFEARLGVKELTCK